MALTATRPYRQTFRNVFSHVEVQPGGCWLWTASRKPAGYGQVVVAQKLLYAHRYIYEILVGPVPDGMDLGHVCHDEDLDCPGGPSCPHRPCVNVSHLRPMTRTENSTLGRCGDHMKNR